MTSITTPDGITLHFGEPEPTEASNPWLAGNREGDQAMSRLRLKYVHIWSITGRPRHPISAARASAYVPSRLFGSAEFMAAYQAALVPQPGAIGARSAAARARCRAAIAAYFGSLEFRALSPGTPAKRRAILNVPRGARRQAGAMLPQKFIEHDAFDNEAARRPQLAQSDPGADCILRRAGDDRQDPTFGIKTPAIEVGRPSHLDRRRDRAIRVRASIGSKARLALALGSTRRSGAATWCALAASTSATASCM